MAPLNGVHVWYCLYEWYYCNAYVALTRMQWVSMRAGWVCAGAPTGAPLRRSALTPTNAYAKLWRDRGPYGSHTVDLCRFSEGWEQVW